MLNLSATELWTSSHKSGSPCPKIDYKKKKKKRHTTFFPGCCFSEWHFVEGGKVIKGFGLEKPFYFSSYWADVNKDVVNVNNDLINQSRWQCQEELESKSRLHPKVIKLDYTLNNYNLNQQNSTWHWGLAPLSQLSLNPSQLVTYKNEWPVENIHF